MTEAPKRRPGRPPLTEAERLIQRSIRMTAEQWEKIDASGGVPWLRQLIDRARPIRKLPKA